MNQTHPVIIMTWGDMIRLILILFILLMILSLKHLYPVDPFVQKYFSGEYEFCLLLGYIVVLHIIKPRIMGEQKRDGSSGVVEESMARRQWRSVDSVILFPWNISKHRSRTGSAGFQSPEK